MLFRSQKSIYGLKQASRSWNIRFDQAVKGFGFVQNLDEPCVGKKYVHAAEARLKESLVYYKIFSILNLTPLIN